MTKIKAASNEHELATKDALRTLLRESAQPVAVVTSYYPFDGVGVDFEEGLDELGKVANTTTATASTKRFHGATLSSFSSPPLSLCLCVLYNSSSFPTYAPF